MSINQIVTPLDSAVLETQEQYAVYFKIVTHAFSELVNTIVKENICTELESTFVQQYCKLFTYSLEAFRIKYLFDHEEKMRIDLTESGFPNFLEFRYLVNDLELKQQYIAKLPKIKDIKSEFLETLLKSKLPISEQKLQQAASIIYYSSVDQQYIFKRFVKGKILDVADKEAGQFLVSWAFYDVTSNRPYICFMYFDLHKETLEDYKEKIYDVLENTADRNMNMEMMAYAIDKKLPNLWPRCLRKLDLGPLHSIFAKDELLVTHAVLKAIAEKTLDLSAFALSMGIAETRSTGNFNEGSFFSKQQLQVWAPSTAHSYLFAPHRVLQVFYDNIPEALHTLTQEPFEIPALKLD